MKYFKENEFHGWLPHLDEQLKFRLDVLRELLGCPLNLSSSPKGIGRRDGDSQSWHNIDFHGKVYAVDGYIPDKVSYSTFYRKAVQAGFTGIGLYSGWSKRGFHVDTRTDRNGKPAATWSGVFDPQTSKTTYGPIDLLLHDSEKSEDK